MNDEEFLGYVEIHSRTELALFHIDHICRLYELAGITPPVLRGSWYGAHSDFAQPLVDMAWSRQENIQKLKDLLK